MKPAHVVILIVASALGGAVMMKAIQKTRPAVRVAAVERVPTPQPEPAPAPVVQAPAPIMDLENAKPSPMPERRAVPKPPSAGPEPVERPVPPPVTAQEPAPPVSSPTAAPPPAPTEPENVTPGNPQGSVVTAPQPHQVTLNAGLVLPVRLVDGLSSERNVPGDAFLATLDKELIVDGFVIAERGARVEGRVVAADRGGKVRGVAALAVELTRLHTSDGQMVAIQTDSFFRRAETTHGDDAVKIGAGAAIGAVIGALAGGGKGAAIGTGVGGGAGAGDVLLTRGKSADLTSETQVTFRLRNAVPLRERRGN